MRKLLLLAALAFATPVEAQQRGQLVVGAAIFTDSISPAAGGYNTLSLVYQTWDPLVATAVERGWVGIEALSGIPGSVGATPIQNVGAYGQEVSQTIASVRVWDRVLRGIRTFAAADCSFGYRTSRFKADPTRHVVLDVTLQLPQGTLGAPVEYAELARALQHAIARLRPEYREVVALRYERDLDYDEIVAITGLPMGTVKSSLHRARKELAEHLEHLGWSGTIH